MTKARKVAAWLLVLCVLGGPLWVVAAEPGTAPAKDTVAPAGKPAEAGSWATSIGRIGACLGAAGAAAGGAYGVSRIGGSCIESIARQPEAARDMFAPMVVAAGMVEVGMLFAIVVCLLSIVL